VHIQPEGSGFGQAYNSRLFSIAKPIMEAERLNQIDNTLADLARRADELRGYL